MFDYPTSHFRNAVTGGQLRIPKRFSSQFGERSWSTVYPEYPFYACCVITFSDRLNEHRLARAVRLSLDAEPILGCRFIEHWFQPYWRRIVDLDATPFCQIRASTNCLADMKEFIEAPPDPPFNVLLLRGDTEMLCVKLDHRIADGQGIKDCVYLLADIYNALGEDPQYIPASNVNGNRSMTQVADQLRLGEKWRILTAKQKTTKPARRFARWHYPIPRSGPWEFNYASGRLEGARLRAIFRYAVRQRATVNHVIMAAFYLAVSEALSHSSEGLLPVGSPVDLRRYLPLKKAGALCNLSGYLTIGIDPTKEKSLDAVVQQIREQIRTEKGRYLGLAPYLVFITLPIVRHVVELIPYAYLKRGGRRVIQRHRSRLEGPVRESHFGGLIMLTDVGELDPARLIFRGTEITDALVTSGVARVPGLVGCCVSAFKDSVTVGLGFGPSAMIEKMFARMMQVLPE
jgi:NRPS condensation-like uncharacterized protein